MAENEKKGGIDGLQNGIKSNDNIEEIDKAATIVIPPGSLLIILCPKILH